MRRWAADNAREKRAAHQYSLEEFGLTREGLEAEFGEYRARYIPSAS
jgi:hypothetical protein